MRHWIGPYAKTFDGPTHVGWQPPTEAVAAVDLRTLADQAVLTQGPQSSRGWFCTPDGVALPSEYEEVTGGRKGVLCALLGLDSRNVAAAPTNPIAFLWEALTDHTDPDGATRPKPIMPTRRGNLDLLLGRRVKRERFSLARDAKQRDVFQRSYAAIRTRDETLARKWLGFQQRKLGLDDTQIKQLQPLIFRHEKPLPPETTVTETFTRADGAGLDADQTWTEHSTSIWTISSNKARTGSTGGWNGDSICMCDANVSGDDQVCTVTYDSTSGSGDRLLGPACRTERTGSASGYGGYIHIGTADPPRLVKTVEGVITMLSYNFSIGTTLPADLVVSADGSSLEFYRAEAPATKATHTDTAITGNTTGGIWAFMGTSGVGLADSWSLTDIVTAPTAPSGLTATANGSSQIDLSWTDNSANEDNFEVERSPNGTDSWVQIATPAADATSYSDTGLDPETTYYYRIRATNAGGDSAWSATTSDTTEPAASGGKSKSNIGCGLRM